MKVLHICFSDRGGAGIAAKRLHNGLLKSGVESKMLLLSGKANHDENIYVYYKNRNIVILYRKIFNAIRARVFIKRYNIPMDSAKCEMVSFPFSWTRVEKHDLVKEAEIIHLHWVSGFVNYKTFFKSVKKPIVWTLHDMNAFLGGMHYNTDIVRNISLENLEKKFKKQKIKAYSNTKKLHIVCLSNYIKNFAENSDVLKGFNHYYIPNGYSPLIQSSIEQKEIKKIFQIPEHKRVLLFVSESISNYRKGFDLLKEAIENIQVPDDFVFVAIGKRSKEINELKNKVLFIGEIYDSRLLELAYMMADFLILPSREDNQPNTMMESLSMGTPVISYSTSGMVDYIMHGKNGYMIETVSSNAMGDLLKRIFRYELVFDKDQIRKQTRQMYSEKVQSGEMMKLYEALT